MLPWAEMWRAALRAGVPPQQFWALSVREWRWLAGHGLCALDQTGLSDLMQAFPDRTQQRPDQDGGKDGRV